MSGTTPLALGIATARVVAAVLDVALAALGIRPGTGLVIDLWIGWALTLGAAELWIIHTRARARSSLTAISAA